MLDKERQLLDRMSSLGITEDDLEEKFIRGSGHGGQKINKTSSCVYLKHVPTGIEIKCQQHRSRARNRILARSELCDQLESRRREAALRRTQKIEKQRRRNRKRSAASKDRMLNEKRLRGSLKKHRSRPKQDD